MLDSCDIFDVKTVTCSVSYTSLHLIADYRCHPVVAMFNKSTSGDYNNISGDFIKM